MTGRRMFSSRDFMGFRKLLRCRAGPTDAEGSSKATAKSMKRCAARASRVCLARRVMAIRPGRHSVGKTTDGVNGMRGRVELVEYLGREQEAAISIDAQTRHLATHGRTTLAPGDNVESDAAAGQSLSYCRANRAQGFHGPRTHRRTQRTRSAWRSLCLAPSLLYVILHVRLPVPLRALRQSAADEGRVPGASKITSSFFADPYQYRNNRARHFALAIPTSMSSSSSPRCSWPTACGAASGWSAPSRPSWCCRSRSA